MSEVLTQAQIDALLNSMAGGGGDAEESAVEKKEEIKYKKYDFFSPKKFTRDKLRLLKSVYETYSRVVSSRLNSVLRTGCQVEIFDVEEQRYYEFANSLHESDVVTLIGTDVGDGRIGEPVIMKVDPSMMLSMIDHMLGSTSDDGDDSVTSYTYTDIELRIYNVIVGYMIDVMPDGWSNYIELNFELERLETEPWMEPPDPVLEAVAALVTADRPAWGGTATELAAAIQTDMKPNALAMRLNVRAGRLAAEYHIRYENSRSHAGRSITLTLEPPQA